MRPLRAALLLAALSAASFESWLTVPAAAQATAAKKLLTYEQVFGSSDGSIGAAHTPSILGRLPTILGWLDGDTYLELRNDGTSAPARVYAIEAADGSSALFRDYGQIQPMLPTGVDADTPEAVRPDGSALIYNDGRDLHYYDAAQRRVRRLTATAAVEKNARFSPDGKSIAYTRGHNLFVFDLENDFERQISDDGSDTVYNGWASWVYYEEILGRASNYAAFWWSPDSRRLAFMRFDDTRVPTFPIFHAEGSHGTLEVQRYPKAGDRNPTVSMGIATVATGTVVWADFDPNADHYLAWPVWTPDSRTLMVQWMNRGQDTLRFYHCDVDSGKKTQVFEERQTSWVEFSEDVTYLNQGGFLLRSNADGWDHLYAHNADGTLKKRLTSGEWRVTSIVRVDETAGYVYFLARQKPTWDTHLMRVRLDGSGLEPLTTSPGAHDVQVSPTAGYFIDRVSTVTAPAKLSLHRGNGAIVRTIGDQRTRSMDDYAWGRAELFTIPSGDGYDLPAYWVLPPQMDPDRRYPVIVSVYGGPDAGTVRNSWLGLTPHYWAQRGVITVSVDHRGSGHFGKKGVALMHRELGRWETRDLIAAVDWLRTKPFVAGDRIGISGASYGGYLALLALTRGAGHFNFGQAGSPVTDWRLYDTVYTERYMDTPAENPDGYKASSVMTGLDGYKSGLRLTHGTTDDNVHLQNSLQLTDWLTTHNKPFEQMFYPGSRHAFAFTQRAHSNREAHDFWMRTLVAGQSASSVSR